MLLKGINVIIITIIINEDTTLKKYFQNKRKLLSETDILIVFSIQIIVKYA